MNPHGLPYAPQTYASAYSATPTGCITTAKNIISKRASLGKSYCRPKEEIYPVVTKNPHPAYIEEE